MQSVKGSVSTLINFSLIGSDRTHLLLGSTLWKRPNAHTWDIPDLCYLENWLMLENWDIPLSWKKKKFKWSKVFHFNNIIAFFVNHRKGNGIFVLGYIAYSVWISTFWDTVGWIFSSLFRGHVASCTTIILFSSTWC